MPCSPRPVAAAGLQLVAAVVDGIALSTIVLHVTEHLGLTPRTTGLVLASAAVAALVLAGPLGVVADRVGLRRAGAVATLGSAAALLGYAVTDSLVAYAASAVSFVVAQAVAGAIRQALAVAGAPPDARLGVRATMHTVLNVGLGLGTVVGSLLAALDSGRAFRAAYVVAGLLSIAAAVVTLRLRGVDERRASVAPPGGLATVLGDRQFVAATALASVVQLTMPVLSVLLPVWVLRHSAAPVWAAGAALALNTVLVIALQRPWSARLTSGAEVVASARLAAAALMGAGVLFTASGAVGSTVGATVLVGLAVVALTLGEVAGGAATWAVALGDVPADAEARYQSVFSMSSSGARIVGPAVALPLVVALPGVGWLVLGLAMAAACLGIGHLAARTPLSQHPTTERIAS